MVGYNFKPVEDLVFSDDFMFGAVMREPKICKGVLERLLQIKIDHLEYPELQKTISPFYTQKGVRLDVYLADSNRVFDVECQTYKIKNIGKRARYYQSMIDIDSLFKGIDYSELKESYIIFICTDDPFNENLPVYTFERICKENADVKLNDCTHHLIFNAAAYKKETNQEIKDFLAFVKDNAVQSDFTKEIAAMVQTKKFQNTFLNEYLAIQLHERDVTERATEKGLAQGIEQGMAKGMAQGMAQGIAQGAKEANLSTAKILKQSNVDIALIAKSTGLSPAEIEAL